MTRHWRAILIALLTGFIVGLPHLFIPRWILPASYDPLQFTYGQGSSITMEEVYTYAPEVREILEGSRFVSDSQVYEYRNTKTPFIGESGDAWIVALLAQMSGSLERGFIVGDFVFPFLTFLFVYFLTLFLSRNKLISVGIATTVVFWTDLIALVPYPHAVWTSVLDSFHPRDFLIMSRSFHPQISLPLYLLAVVFVMIAIRKKQWCISVVAGISGGFLFYSYIFSWTSFFGGLGIFGIFTILTRRWAIFKHLLIIVSCAFLVALPYMHAAWMFRQGGSSHDFFQKLSLPKRGFSDLVARHFVFVGLYIVVRRKRWTLNDWLFLSFWIAPLILPNLSQEILGKDLEGKHWIRRLAYPMSTIGLGVVAVSLIPKKLLNIGGVVILAVILSRGAILQYSMAKKSAQTYRLDEQKNELFEWINRNTEQGTVIASLDWEMIASLPAKTRAFNFAPIGMRTIASSNETIERYLWTYALLGTRRGTVDVSFSDPSSGETGIAVSRSVYFLYAQPDRVFMFPPEERERVMSEYGAISERMRRGDLPPFRLDYLMVGDFERQLVSEDFFEHVGKPTFSNSTFSMWKFSPQLRT